jgi:RNA polymerase sigma factor (sigma-70 family)
MDVERIFDRPGITWTREERVFVIDWLYRPAQHRRLLTFARNNLGKAATRDDAEDVWQEFSVGLEKGVINLYDPGRGKRFWSFLLSPCFQQYCWKRGKVIRRREATEPVEDEAVAVPDPRSLESSIVDRDSLRTALRMLGSACRALIVMAYVEGRSGQEIALTYGISPPNVRVRLFRCVRELRAFLVQNASA